MSCLLKQGQTAAARSLVHDANGFGPDPAIRPLLAAKIEESAGQLAAAQKTLQQAVLEAPHDLDLQDALCRHLSEYAAPADAEVALQTLVAQSPDNAAALYNLASVRFRREQYAAAAETYEASLALRPIWPPALDRLAICYERLGHNEEALALIAEKLQFGSNHTLSRLAPAASA